MSFSQVLNLSSVDGSGLITLGCQITFLDEFRVMIKYFDCATGLSVFNTFVPQDHPGNFRRFGLPRKYHGRCFDVHLDRDRSLGIVNRDGPLVVDSTQDIFIVDFPSSGAQSRVFLILRTQPLIEHAYSKSEDVQISWGEWERDTVAMEVPISDSLSSAVIHGARLLVVSMGYGRGRGYRICPFDFSRRGIAALQVLDGDEDGTWRRAIFEHGHMFKERVGLVPWESHSLGDSAAFYFVSLLSCPARECVVDLFTDQYPFSGPDRWKRVWRVFDMM